MTGIARSPALFLDRDGVINVDHGYVHRIDHFEFVPGIFELARFAIDRGWPIVVVTNQGGIGQGLYSEADHQALSQWMCDRFASERAPIARVYHCPFHPTLGIGEYRADHAWRKPNPGMILQAARDLDLDLSRSSLIGDRVSDIAAAASAGIPGRIRLDPEGKPPESGVPEHRVARDLSEALALLREFSGAFALSTTDM
jgi:D-glycero-D-manno-heptose 1,7-bisphosphate phosphatase